MRIYSSSRDILTKTKLTILRLFFASVLLTFTACGGGGGGGTPPPVNTAPIATAQSVTTAYNTSVDITLSGTDANGDSLSYSVSTQPTNGALSGTAPNLSYIPTTDFTGDDSFTFTVNDGSVDSAPATISISVTPPDSTPDPFSFTDVPEALSDALVTSNSVLITGIEIASDVSITGGEYSINGGAFTSTAGTVSNDQSVVVRLSSSATAGASVDATLTVGGVSDTFSVTTSSDVTPPTANIVYPSASSLTSSDTVIVRGVTVDDGTVASVSVNGTEAITTDNFVNWTAEVPLLSGFNTLTVTASDLGRNTNTNVSSIEVESRPIFRNKAEIHYNNSSNKLVFFDDTLRGLYDFDPASLNYNLISDDTRPDNINSVRAITDFDISEVTNSAYFLDASTFDKVLQVDLDTGSRSIITADTESVAAHTLLQPNHIQIDAAANTGYILDSSASGSGRRAILKFNLSTGAASVLTEGTFSWPDSIALDKANNRILLADTIGNDRIFAFDLDTGAKSTLWDSNNTLSLGEPKGIAVDATNNRALIYDDRANGIFAIDLETGLATTVLDNVALSVNVFTVMDMVYDGANSNNRVFIAANNRNVVQIDLTTGAESVFSSNTIPNTTNPLSRVTGLALDSANNRLLVTDAGGTVPAVLAVDLDTGARTLISNASTPDATNPLNFPTDVGILDNNSAYVIDSENLSLKRIDLAIGTRTTISDNTVIDANNTFDRLTGIAQDTANNRTLVVDRGRDTLLSVDNFTGERSVISDRVTPDDINPLEHPIGLILQGGRGLISDFITDSIISVDLLTGARTVFSGPSVPFTTDEFGAPITINGLNAPTRMTLDTANNRLLVIDDSRQRVMAVSLVDGSRSILTSNTVPDSINPVVSLLDITLDTANQRALVVDEGLQAVLAIDLGTGERTPYIGTIPQGSAVLSNPASIAFDSANSQAIVGNGGGLLPVGLTRIDAASGARAALNVGGANTQDIAIASNNKIYTIGLDDTLNEVNTSTGALTLISGPDLPINDSFNRRLVGLTLDEENDLAYVSDQITESILSVNLTTGTRTLISSNVFPDALVFDKDNARLLVIDTEIGGILAVNIATGAHTILSSDTVPDEVNQFGTLVDAILDKSNNRLLVLDASRDTVMAVDLGTGARTNLGNITGVVNLLSSPQEMILMPSANQLMITDSINGVVLMDLETGEQVILSK